MTSSFGPHGRVILTNKQFEDEYVEKISRIIKVPAVNRGPAHAMKDDTTASTHELMNVTEHIKVDAHQSAWIETVKPNLPWAEDHFQERIGGDPLNPSPSEAWWPFARKNNAEHKDAQEKFSHTYPERFWPKFAGEPSYSVFQGGRQEIPHRGIRFDYGDFDDLLKVLKHNPMTRQAYLPIWFPEDLAAARDGLRVPCSMGYHFIWCGECRALDCVYTMRSCDLVRFYRDDLHMAGRLLQHVAHEVQVPVGTLVVHIDNLHCFPGDIPLLHAQLPKESRMYPTETVSDKRSSYNFDGMY